MKSGEFRNGYVATAIAVALLSAPVFAGLSFIPDSTFNGSSLTGWHILGQADWRVQGGELIGTVKQGGGGWLVLDRSYQDVGFHAMFRCTGGCTTGVLIRAEKTPTGMKGVYVSLNEERVPSFAVTLDADGRELQREALRPIGGLTRVAPPSAPDAAGRGGAGRGGAGGGRGGPQVAFAHHASRDPSSPRRLEPD